MEHPRQASRNVAVEAILRGEEFKMAIAFHAGERCPTLGELERDLCADSRNLEPARAGVQAWLAENSWHFGFVQRYPAEKPTITGVDHEPQHYRYVGPEAAHELWHAGQCLEEYTECASAAPVHGCAS